MSAEGKRHALSVVALATLAAVVAAAAAIALVGSSDGSPSEPLYVVIMTHVEGDDAEPEGSPGCPSDLDYQTLPLPLPGEPPGGRSFALDIVGTERLREIFQNYSDSYGGEPKLFIEPAGEFWETEADPSYGGKLFQTYDYQALGYEFGIQGHGIYYSGTEFCWYLSPHTQAGVQLKLTTLHNAAQTVLRNGQPVNDGLTYTGGWKLEKDLLGDAYAEYVIDHAAADLGYRIAFEDHDGHIEDEPPGIDNSRASYYVYRADYGDGVQIIKIDFNGSVNTLCQGNTPRCETPAEAIARFDATVAAKDADNDPSHVYFFAFTVHSDSVWLGFHEAGGGPPTSGEGAALLALMDDIEARRDAGTQIKYVTPSELATIFEAANPPPLPYEASPFGFHPASIGFLPDLSFAEAQDIGVRWHRPPVYAFWFLIQPDLGSPTYDWSLHDAQYGAVPAGINILANITVGPESEGYSLPGSYLPVDSGAYQDFVRATVERYDGDGVDDMPGLVVPIRYWQVDNEPNNIVRSDFAQLQALTYTAIKDACSDCQVLIGGATGFPENFVANFLTNYAPILEALNGQYVDIFDFHWYGNATGDYRLLGDALTAIQAKLQETGFDGIPIWVTEMGTYSGDPVDFPFGELPYQSEEQQAGDLLKRFVYPISLGIEKVFPAFGLIEGFKGDDGYFDHTGLIYDGQGSDDRGLGVKKVGYYTYKLMTEKLEGAAFDHELIGLPADVYAYEFTDAGGAPITVLWYDDFTGGPPTRDVTLTVASPSVLVTDAVTDDQGNVTSVEVPVISGSVTLTLGQSPVFVEEAPSYVIEDVETWVTAPNGNQLYTRIVQPDAALYPGQRFPALIAIPGGTGAGAPLADVPLYRDLAASGFVVVVFNAEGRGSGLPGNLVSEGTDDCNGFLHQDDLKAVVEYTAALPNVDASNIGVETSSFGIAIGAGALGRYPNLPVAYLVDQEGPHDNLVITFYDAGRETAVCGHLSTVTDPSPENVAFWAEREAVRYIGGYRGYYLRMQAEIDHAQNPGYYRHAIEMINAATRPEFGGTGSALWTRMNGSDIGNAINAVYPLSDPSQYPTWVLGRLSGHLGLHIAYDREIAALVASADSDGDGFTDAIELVIGTYPTDACPATGAVSHGPGYENDEDPDAWPADMNDNQVVNLSDMLFLAPPVFFSIGPNPPYQVRYDLNLDNVINLSDVLYLAPPVFFATCTP